MHYLVCEITPSKGFRHPITEKTLEAVLDGRLADRVRAVFFTKHSNGTVLSARFDADGLDDSSREAGLATILVHPVRARERKKVRALLRERGLDCLVAWLASARRDCGASPEARSRIDIRYEGGRLTVHETSPDDE